MKKGDPESNTFFKFAKVTYCIPVKLNEEVLVI